jgi:carbamate kinase
MPDWRGPETPDERVSWTGRSGLTRDCAPDSVVVHSPQNQRPRKAARAVSRRWQESAVLVLLGGDGGLPAVGRQFNFCPVDPLCAKDILGEAEYPMTAGWFCYA